MGSDPVSRRRFLTVFLVAGPTLAVVARIGLDGASAPFADNDAGVRSP
ncbi:MAG: hypothetical protein LC792_00325 [Actinobacteria bacterium]|nr:hypothetical protein [Actinomycetota bacterium]